MNDLRAPKPAPCLVFSLSLLAIVGLCSLLAISGGCRVEQENSVADVEQPVDEQPPLRLTVVDDPALAEAIERHWKARAGGDIAVQTVDSSQIREAKHLNTDVIVYPSALLGLLAERRWIVEFPNEVLQRPEYQRDRIFVLQRLHEPAWGRSIQAVSLGSPQLVLAYRKDLFAQRGLTPPTTWKEYQELVESLADRSAIGEDEPDDEAWSATVEPLADEWAALTLLARSASYARHRSQFSSLFDVRTMQPLIDGTPFVRALKEFQAAIGSAGTESEWLTPADAFQRLMEGRTAMAITWPAPGRGVARDAASLDAAIGFAELPGSPEAYNFREQRWEPRGDDEDRRVPLVGVSGRLGSIASVARHPRAAANMLAWLTDAEMSGVVSPDSSATTLFRQTHLTSPRLWVGAPLTAEAAAEYAAVVEASQNRSWWLDSLRIPGRERYLDALGTAVRQALAAEQSPEQALQTAAEAWQSITEELGVESQRQAYRHSLGLE